MNQNCIFFSSEISYLAILLKIAKLATLLERIYKNLFFVLGLLRYIIESHISQICVPGQPWAPPGMPDKSARIVTVKELQPSIAVRNTNELKIRPHLEAVADIEKPIISPLSTYKFQLNGICHTSRAFCSSKNVHF